MSVSSAWLEARMIPAVRGSVRNIARSGSERRSRLRHARSRRLRTCAPAITQETGLAGRKVGPSGVVAVWFIFSADDDRSSFIFRSPDSSSVRGPAVFRRG